jgi:hypothetical protein
MLNVTDLQMGTGVRSATTTTRSQAVRSGHLRPDDLQDDGASIRSRVTIGSEKRMK